MTKAGSCRLQLHSAAAVGNARLWRPRLSLAVAMGVGCSHRCEQRADVCVRGRQKPQGVWHLGMGRGHIVVLRVRFVFYPVPFSLLTHSSGCFRALSFSQSLLVFSVHNCWPRVRCEARLCIARCCVCTTWPACCMLGKGVEQVCLYVGRALAMVAACGSLQAWRRMDPSKWVSYFVGFGVQVAPFLTVKT